MKPFYLMEQSREFNGGRSPQNKSERMDGLTEAIRATRKKVAEYKTANADASELETHLKNLEKRLEAEKNPRG
ncbi:MAG: hypothetical protein UT29_C0003G0038 [Candidatus Yanofskybacteria bacterium GW2011_GWA1_39_13]|uniref:Uncharacterized protein n=1 Tax=Yanofskybacteria sp. (strain GW2011_GWA1_39_13) TaxID=1619019 RepID=A0A0G0QL11_YANXG|nr:MAG: hypothetical protein UT29_C0003G0038 [Candidatus Yanofskybacteria bacterium GW2011_GWA1_39_13]